MSVAQEKLGLYIGRLEKIIIEFNFNEDGAAKLLEELKADMGKKTIVSPDEKELFEACIYNALATINTVLEQGKKSNQLLMSLTEAKEEMKAIMELL